MILKSFRDASHSPIIKILFAAIIFSFCLWGVGDIIRNYSASKAVFTIDKRDRLTVDQFLRDYTDEKQRIRNIGSKPLSDAEMEKLHIKDMVLKKLLNSMVFELTYNKLGIIIPKKSLLDVVHSLPEFQNNGGFDSRVYEMTIRKSGLSEQDFLRQIRDNLARTQLLHPIAAGYKLPSFIKQNIAKEYEAQNTVLISKIDINDLKFNKKVSNDELKQYYQNSAEKYKNPESRDVSVLVIDYRNLASGIDIDEDKVDTIYQESKDAYKQSETRDFERFVFETKEESDKAWNMMNQGISSQEIIKKLTPDMESVRETHLADFPEKVGRELFSLKKGQASEVYAIGGKYYIYRLTNINKAKVLSESDIKDQIRKELQNDKLNSPEFYAKIKEMKNKIDDGFGAGKTADQIAHETGMKLVNLSGIEKDYDNPEVSSIVSDEDTRAEVIDSIFSTEENQASQTIDSKETDTMSYVVIVKKIKKAMIPEFDSIKEQVKNDYIFENKEKDFLSDMNEISALGPEAIKSIKSKYKTRKVKFSKKDLITNIQAPSGDVKRVLDIVQNPNVVFAIVSNLHLGEVSYYKISEKEYVVAGIEKIDQIAEPSSEFYGNISNYIDQAASNEVVNATLNAFKKTMKIDIDNKLIEEITKNSDENNQE